jgi:hypothetical protein
MNPYKSKKWYLSMHRLARSLTNQSCGPLLIWNGTLFSKMAPWCGQVRGHSLFDKKFLFNQMRHMCNYGIYILCKKIAYAGLCELETITGKKN